MSNICYHFQLNQVLFNQSEHYHQLYILEFSVYKKIFPHYVSVFQSRVESVNVFAVIVFFFFKHSKYLNNTINAYIIRNKENLFCSNNAPKTHIFNSQRHQKLLLVANQLPARIMASVITKLLPSLFELKDIKTIDTSTIIKKWQDMSRNVHF